MYEKEAENIETGLEIAVIGIDLRFPGAKNKDQFWDILKHGQEPITFFSDQELEEAGAEPGLLQNTGYVKAKPVIENIEYFDASFFGYIPKEAEILDPQIRIFHECAWKALEDAGYVPGSLKELTGCYAGASTSFYWEALSFMSGKIEELGQFEARYLYDKDVLCTRVAHKLDLKGPAVSVHTTCSTSLVAIHLGCQGLISGECDIALAGGISVSMVNKSGYMYQKGMILSPDGHCRPFDAQANGTIFGDGVGVVVLKRLQEAISAGDNIYAVIKGSFINNDGINKAGYTAPGIEGQAKVIRGALQAADVSPESITYIETHGTGTSLGDPVEIEGLKLAFKPPPGTPAYKENSCAIGSVKSNFGHLNTAAGVAGFIKTVLALQHRQIPPGINFNTPNPKIRFENSPFFVNTGLIEWKNDNYPLRAGVSSFGIGGTNAHVILEQAPRSEGTRGLAPLSVVHSARNYQLILLSAKTPPVLENMTANLANHLKERPDISLPDTAYTLQVGRKAFQHRKMLVCSTNNEMVEALSAPQPDKIYTSIIKNENNPVVFMFPGQGAQYVDMGLELYRAEPVFREEMDRCFEILKSQLDYDIKKILYPAISPQSTQSTPSVNFYNKTSAISAPSAVQINQTEIAQPLIFIFEYALAKLLLAWGIKPQTMIGHSIGQYTAAHLAGVFTLEDALKLVALRGKLMQKMPPGAMLSIPLPPDQLTPLLDHSISLAAVNSSAHCVISGEAQALRSFEKKLQEKGHRYTYLHTSHAFHSKMMDPVIKEFERQISQIKLNKPALPFISNVTGAPITAAEAVDPGYWAKHIRSTVRFADGLHRLLEEAAAVFIEVGPGNTLSTFVRQHKNKKSDQFVVDLVKHPQEKKPADYYLLSSIGQLWLYGIKIGWTGFYVGEKRHRISLPTYPFAGQRFEIPGDPLKSGGELLYGNLHPGRKADIADWFYIPSWKRSDIITRKNDDPPGGTHYLVFMDDCGLGTRLVKALEQKGQKVIMVKAGAAFARRTERVYIVNPGESKDYHALFAGLREEGKIPDTIIHLWNVSKRKRKKSRGIWLENNQDLGFHSLINIAQAIGKYGISNKIQIKVVTDHMQEVTGGDLVYPGKAVILGPIKVIPLEYPNIGCCSIDICHPGTALKKNEKLIPQLLAEITGESNDKIIAYRNNYRWVQVFAPIRLEKSPAEIPRLRKEGVYLVTGGLGGIGLELARYLAGEVQARLILTGRSGLPPRDRWEQWFKEHNEDDSQAKKIRKIQELEKLGSEVLVCEADVTNHEQMQKAAAQAAARFGPINGVIHAAGLADGEMIQRRTKEKSARILAPKVRGTLVLHRIFKDEKMDFFIFCSSISSILAPFGQVAYCAANSFLDAFALRESRRGKPFISINWDRWQNVGMALIGEKLGEEMTGEKITGGITAREGIEALSRILGNTLPQVAVKYNDLNLLVERRNRAQTPTYIKELEKITTAGNISPRPPLTTVYTAPGNELEERLAGIFQGFFGIDKVGIHDDFFQLGGDSLKAITLAAHINKEYPVSLNDLLAYPTINGLASLIGEKNIPGKSTAGHDEENLLARLECIERLNKGNNEKNIFIIHPLHGMVSQYKELAVLLGNNYNIYGIQARGLVPGTGMTGTPAEMINDYLHQVLAAQGSGTYIIAGYCVGNIIAYEIVRKLESMNYTVEKLIMFDAHDFFAGYFLKALRVLEHLPGFVKKMIISSLENRVKRKKLKEKPAKITIAGSDNEQLQDDAALRKEKVRENIGFLARHLLPLELIKAPVLVIKARQSNYPLATGEYFSKMTKGKASLIETPGDHDSIFEKPYVDRLAEILKEK